MRGCELLKWHLETKSASVPRLLLLRTMPLLAYSSPIATTSYDVC